MTSRDQGAERHVSSFHAELLRLGEASAAERAWIEGHLESCPACAAMTAELDAARDEFTATVAPRSAARLSARLAERRRGGGRPRWGWLSAGLLIPSAAVVVALVAVRRPPPVTGGAAGPAEARRELEPDYTEKGGGRAQMMVAARRGTRVFAVRPGELLQAGDQIRFVIQGARHPFVMIASVDGRGHANVYVPYDGVSSLAVAPGARIEMPGSIVIDDSPGPERLFALLSHRPIDAAKVRAALGSVGGRGAAAIRSTTALDVGADEQVSMLVEKASP